MNVVFAGGGTGGHLYPAIAIADELKRRDPNVTITFVGTADRLERTIVPQAGYPLETISAKPFSKTPAFFIENGKGIFQSFRALRKLRPDIVIATGGYVSFPFVVATRLRYPRLPIALLEPNVRPGLTNRMLVPFVNETWREIPLRASLAKVRTLSKGDACARLGLDPERNTLLVIGGSQGARSINMAAIDMTKKELLPDWQVLLIAGKIQDPIPSDAGLHVVEYFDDMSDAYAAADLAVGRAGASTLAELKAVGLRAVLVPLPSADRHQDPNAYAFSDTGQGVVLSDDQLNAETLVRAVEQASVLPIPEPLPGSPVESIVARIDALLSRKQR